MEVKIELGHKAWKNIKLTKEGYTHDFSLFVQGVNGKEIKHIVEKIVFHLPNSYPDPNRTKDKPPYILSESTSKSLSIEIDVFFCAESTLKKVHYIYDIFIGDEEVNTSWEKKLAFPNPSKEFKEKLLLAGGEQVDLLEAFPLMTGEFIKIKEEPVDETEIVNNVDKAQSNTTVQKIDNLQNKGSTSSERQISLSKLLEENKNLKNANIEIKDKINRQEKLMAYYEEHFSHYEENILNANVGINKLKKKIEADEKEVINLKLQLQMIQVKRKLKKIQSTPDHPEKRTRGIKRKNEGDLSTSATVAKEKENVILSSPKFISSFSSTSLKSPPFKNAFASIENQNACETIKSNSATSAVQPAPGNPTAIDPNGARNTPPGNCLPSHSKNETPSQNGNSSNQKNLHKNQDIVTLNRSKDVSFADTSSFKSTNTRDGGKSIEGNSNKASVSLNKPNIKNKNIEKPVNPSSVNVNSFLNSPDVIIIDAEKSVKGKTPEIITIDAEGSSSKANVSLNSPEIIIIDDEESTKRCSVKTNVITIDDEESTKGNLVNANDSLNKPHAKNNDIKKPVFESSVKANSSLKVPELTMNAVTSAKRSSTNANTFINKSGLRNNNAEKAALGSMSKLCIEPYNTNTTQEQLGTPVQENHISSTQRTNINSSNLNCKQNGELSNLGGVVIPSQTLKEIQKSGKNKKKAKKKNCKQNHELSNLGGITIPIQTMKQIQTNGKNKNKAKKSNSDKLLLSVERLNSGNKLHTEPSSSNKKSEQQSFSNKETDINSNSNCIENGGKIPNGQIAKRDVFQSEKLQINSVCKEFYEALNDTSAPKFTSFLTEHCPKLKMEFNRLKNSEFGKYRKSTNPLCFKLQNIDSHSISDQIFFQYVRAVVDYFSNPKTLDMPTLIYLIVDFLYHDRINPENLSKYFENQDICVYLLPSENSIVHALFELERKALPHLNGLIRNTLNIIHRVLVSKSKLPPYGLASLCRVFMEICKCKLDRWEPLFLCCELLRLGHPLSSYLINSLAAVWRYPFNMQNNFSVEENMLLGSIHYGMQEKPLLMNCDLWRLTLRLRSTYFPRPLMVNPPQAIRFLTNEIVSRCVEGSFQEIWMLASPLVIFVSKETWDWKIGFKNEYLIPKLQQFCSSSNEKAFVLFCNLYLDICIVVAPQNPDEQMLRFFTDENFYIGVNFVQDWAAIALLKYIGITDKHIPKPLRDWFLRNQDNPKLAILINLYCKKVMESHDNLLLWDDIMIV